jgi:beta-glucosidase/6-phospho-beta-glucosidase/beta-galactosidase
MITENGIADATDRKRGKYIFDHLRYTKKALDEGVNVIGYLHWSLIDNFEWARGFNMKFGLLDRNRNIRQSAFVYRDIIDANRKFSEAAEEC